MSLREAVQQAVLTNPKIEAAQSAQRASRYGLDQAKGRLFPEVDLDADIGQQRINRPNGLGPDVNDEWNNRRQATLRIRQVLFDGWDRANDIYRSQANISAASYQVLVRSEAVGLSSVEAYIDVVRHDRSAGLGAGQCPAPSGAAQDHPGTLRRRKVADRRSGADHRAGRGRQGAGRPDQGRPGRRAKQSSRMRSALEPTKLRRRHLRQGNSQQGRRSHRAGTAQQPQGHGGNGANAMPPSTNSSSTRRRCFRRSISRATRRVARTSKARPGRNDEYGARVVMRWKLFDGGVRRSRIAELGERHSEKIAEQLILARQLTEEVEVAWARLVDGRAQVEAVEAGIGSGREGRRDLQGRIQRQQAQPARCSRCRECAGSTRSSNCRISRRCTSFPATSSWR